MMQRAPYASMPEESRGRLHAEPESANRSPFQRDRDRIIHSSSFRRLKHKTQVFVCHEGDYYRTRLTHSLEVAQIARSISRSLGLDEDLAEALALAHDLGHTPFGHAGETALDECMREFGGFDHNDQTLRILTRVEQHYAEFDGLNLTWETLEGTVKHNGPLLKPGSERKLPETISAHNRLQDLELATYPGAEAQVAALSDDIAYNNHDIDDGLRAGLFGIRDLVDLPLVGPVFLEVMGRYSGIAEPRLIHESIRRIINLMVTDLIDETRERLAASGVKSAADIRNYGHPLVAFSDRMRANDRAVKEFLFERMYRHYKVNRMAAKARRIVKEIFDLLLAEPGCLPTEWRPADWRLVSGMSGEAGTARLVADYIAGMTDRFALDEHARLFEPYATTT